MGEAALAFLSGRTFRGVLVVDGAPAFLIPARKSLGLDDDDLIVSVEGIETVAGYQKSGAKEAGFVNDIVPNHFSF